MLRRLPSGAVTRVELNLAGAKVFSAKAHSELLMYQSAGEVSQSSTPIPTLELHLISLYKSVTKQMWLP